MRSNPSAASLLIALVLTSVGLACAPKQQIPLHCVPRTVTLWVDKEIVTEIPPVLELRADQPHTLFFKGGGYETKMLVLETQIHEGRPKLSPSDPCREVRFVERNRDLKLEVESDEPSAP